MKYRLASYELCGLAVVAFIIDHIGAHFFSDNLWFRIFRLFGLVWFFPAGYNSAWRSTARVWWGIAVLTVLDAVIYTSYFPVCAVATLVAARALVDPVMTFSLKGPRRFWAVQALLVVLILPINEYLEYGTIALLIANAGWLLRHRAQAPTKIVRLPHYFVFVTAIYLAYSQLTFGFTMPQLAVVTASTGLTAWLMYHFNDLIREDLRRLRERADWVRRAARFIAHRSLEIYVVHLAVFKVMEVVAMSR
ncbi:MAG: hypothetical protein EPN97_13890 [Alphaproteobacteria bacterium]|nr:MAG: hypothetical protein EPN97_13890 [Alphaproteobacteria bacterium]